MAGNDIDPHLLKCIGLLYESKTLRKGDSVPLQHILEQAIFQKTGIVKDYSDFFQSQLPPRETEEAIIATTIYDDQDNSDNDLELDLFKDDLSCVICNKMDVGARNRLLECSDCHGLYHQECHKPVVAEEDVVDTWTCWNCKSSKKIKEHSSSKKSESIKHGLSSSHKSSSDKYKTSSSSSKSSKSSSSSPSHSSRSEDKKSSSSKSKQVSSSKYYPDKRKHD